MNPQSEPDDIALLLHAWADGELDPPAALAMQRRLAADPALAAQLAQLQALGQAVRAAAPIERASPEFARRMASLAAPMPAQARWRGWAMAASVAAILLAGSLLLQLRQDGADEALASVLSGHMRALAAAQPFDIASSDRHTVKPWFDGRLAFAPVVVDLAAEGYPLAGGRVDAISGQIAATMVYRSQNHILSLTEARTAALPARPWGAAPASERSRDGYAVLNFSEGDLTFWLVTDLPLLQARGFVAAWKARAAAL